MKYFEIEIVYLGTYQGFDLEIIHIFVTSIGMALPSKLQRTELVYF